MAAPTIKSRPVYPGLQIAPHARRHLFVLEGEGAQALMDQALIAPAAAGGADFLASADVLYVARASQALDRAGELRKLPLHDLYLAPSVPTLLSRLRAVLANASMGTRIYVSGTEGFIGQATQVAMEFGVDPASIITEHRGSLARRVQCVHCKGITENVTGTPFKCSHCGLSLFVRDHYSRRIGAFQGVNVDAETPGTVPAAQELYP